MSSLHKFEKIISWFAQERFDGEARLRAQTDFARIDDLHRMIGTVLPMEVIELLHAYDGEEPGSQGAFFGHGVMGLDKILATARFALGRVKPDNPVVPNPAASERLIERLTCLYRRLVSHYLAREQLPARWHRVEFQCAPDAFGGPYLYLESDTPDQDRIILSPDEQAIKFYRRVGLVIRKLHKMEAVSYNWDELNVVAYADGTHRVERSNYALDDGLSSNPPGAIKPYYFHLKWIPLIEDHGGNYIGVDLDPGPSGTKGQVIVFGRDEYEMFVLAPSWDAFLDRMLAEIDRRPFSLNGDVHLHDHFRPFG